MVLGAEFAYLSRALQASNQRSNTKPPNSNKLQMRSIAFWRVLDGERIQQPFFPNAFTVEKFFVLKLPSFQENDRGPNFYEATEEWELWVQNLAGRPSPSFLFADTRASVLFFPTTRKALPRGAEARPLFNILRFQWRWGLRSNWTVEWRTTFSRKLRWGFCS